MPVVLSREEVKALLEHCKGEARLPAAMLYGCGLRSMECLELRVGDVDLYRQTVRVHAGKGGKDRMTVLPESLIKQLKAHIAVVRDLHECDLANGIGEAKLPHALRRKLGKATKRFYWQFLFPSGKLCADPRDPGPTYRWHMPGQCCEGRLHMQPSAPVFRNA